MILSRSKITLYFDKSGKFPGRNIIKFVLCEWVKLKRRWPCHLIWSYKWSSLQGLSLFDKDVITLGPFMIVGTYALPVLRIRDFPELIGSKFFCFQPCLGLLMHSSSLYFLELFSTDCRQIWMQQESYYIITCDKYCGSGYGDLWLQHIMKHGWLFSFCWQSF